MPEPQLLHASLAHVHQRFLRGARDVAYVFAPYIQRAALETLLVGVAPRVDAVVITSWELTDLADGASDLGVFDAVRDRGGYLYLLPGLHMKVLSCDLDSAIVTSANVTARALGLGHKSNIECGVLIERLPNRDRIWLRALLQKALLVNQDLVDELRGVLKNIVRTELVVPKFDLAPYLNLQPFLLSALPMSASPRDLCAAIDSCRRGDIECLLSEEWAAALHDIALYELELELESEALKQQLQERFSMHPFIRALCAFVEDRRYFGEVKEWLQRTCTNVPVPRRRDLTGHVRVLFDWLTSMQLGFRIERPRHSECLVRKR